MFAALRCRTRLLGLLLICLFDAAHALDLDPALMLEYTSVATAAAFQEATEKEVKHILVVAHLNFTEAEANSVSADGRYPDSALAVYGGTVSIVGRCFDPPAPELAANWIPGHCILLFTHLGGITTLQKNNNLLWLAGLHVILGADEDASSNRRGLATDQVASKLYMTSVTFEELHGSPKDSSAMVVYTSMIASELRVLNFGPSSTSALWVPFGSDATAKKGVSLLNSTIAGTRIFAVPECAAGDPFYCWPASIYACANLRLDNCTFANTTSSSGFEVEIEINAEVYGDGDIEVGRRAVNGENAGKPGEPLPLSSVPNDAFLSFEDAEFLTIKAEVETVLSQSPSSAPTPAPAPTGAPTSPQSPPVSPASPSSPSPGSPEPAPSVESAPASCVPLDAVMGPIVGLVMALMM